MNTEFLVSRSIFLRSPVMRMFRWLFSWRGIRRILFILVWIATAVALFYAEENWRGRRAWNYYKGSLVARGIQVNYEVLWPKPVPEKQNFAATPVVQSWFTKPYASDPRWNDSFKLADKAILGSKYRTSLPGTCGFMDLVAWEKAFADIKVGKTNFEGQIASKQLDTESRAKAAPAVLQALKSSDPLFAELRTASRRPYAQYPLRSEQKSEFAAALRLPHLPNLSQISMRLQLKACAELALGQSDQALEDLRLMLYLVDTVKDEPVIYSQWNRICNLQMVLQPVWEGLAQHAWSQPQLVELASRLRHYDLFQSCELALDAERAGTLWTIDYIPKSDRFNWMFNASRDNIFAGTMQQFVDWPDLVRRGVPSGWYAREKLNYCRVFQMHVGNGFDPYRKRVSPSIIESRAAEAKRLVPEKSSLGVLKCVLDKKVVLASDLFQPDLNLVIRRFVLTQAGLDEAAIACALEQYRLAHGQFPDALQALVPDFLPQLPKDAITGELYKYRPTQGGKFLLYSVGWNERDDNGAVSFLKSGAVDLNQGDWAWANYAK